MLTPDFSRFVLIPLFVLNMGAMIITLFIKKKIKPEFSRNLDVLFFVENVIGLICCIALGYIAFFVD
ncbi:hypothetical protein [Desulfosporosinus hippei]|uniref:Uncharacterized protein n=1 Tax=Desulfosporosinus hippei DSM 8344 TaxID=1121419 RepID=A0A1G8KBW9_9FIRM|nr:hypothetical protein [Desulfosporosinus hippei]SDI40360.1 hypothetical protein SAMN05443529_1375 [Desulfosporosinus hippei DSM 8344]